MSFAIPILRIVLWVGNDDEIKKDNECRKFAMLGQICSNTLCRDFTILLIMMRETFSGSISYSINRFVLTSWNSDARFSMFILTEYYSRIS